MARQLLTLFAEQRMDIPVEDIEGALARMDTTIPLHSLEHCLETMLGLQHGGLSGLTAYGPNKRQRVHGPAAGGARQRAHGTPAGGGRRQVPQPNQHTPRRSARLQHQAARRQGRRPGN